MKYFQLFIIKTAETYEFRWKWTILQAEIKMIYCLNWAVSDDQYGLFIRTGIKTVHLSELESNWMQVNLFIYGKND